MVSHSAQLVHEATLILVEPVFLLLCFCSPTKRTSIYQGKIGVLLNCCCVFLFCILEDLNYTLEVNIPIPTGMLFTQTPFFLSLNINYLFSWLHWVFVAAFQILAVACKLLAVACGIWFPDQRLNLGSSIGES